MFEVISCLKQLRLFDLKTILQNEKNINSKWKIEENLKYYEISKFKMYTNTRMKRKTWKYLKYSFLVVLTFNHNMHWFYNIVMRDYFTDEYFIRTLDTNLWFPTLQLQLKTLWTNTVLTLNSRKSSFKKSMQYWFQCSDQITGLPLPNNGRDSIVAVIGHCCGYQSLLRLSVEAGAGRYRLRSARLHSYNARSVHSASIVFISKVAGRCA